MSIWAQCTYSKCIGLKLNGVTVIPALRQMSLCPSEGDAKCVMYVNICKYTYMQSAICHGSKVLKYSLMLFRHIHYSFTICHQNLVSIWPMRRSSAASLQVSCHRETTIRFICLGVRVSNRSSTSGSVPPPWCTFWTVSVTADCWRNNLQCTDDKLFDCVLCNDNHVPHEQLSKHADTAYNLQTRCHDRTIPEKTGHLAERNYLNFNWCTFVFWQLFFYTNKWKWNGQFFCSFNVRFWKTVVSGRLLRRADLCFRHDNCKFVNIVTECHVIN